MASSHEFSSRLVILKTQEGYLTKYGFTKNVMSDDILFVKAGSIGGKYVPKEARIKKFLELLNVDIVLKEEDCEFFTYYESDTNRSNLYKWY